MISSANYSEGSSPSGNQARLATAIAKQAMTTLKIRMMVDSKAVIATLDDNPTARDFYSLLPLTLILNDYATTEKVATLPRNLSKDGAPAGAKPEIGDIGYYAPWGNLAIYYEDFAYSDGLIKLGRIDYGLDMIKAAGSPKVAIEALRE